MLWSTLVFQRGWFLSTYPSEIFLYGDESTENYWWYKLYIQDMAKDHTDFFSIENISDSRVCPTFRKTSTVETKIPVAVSLAIWTYITQLSFFFSFTIKKNLLLELNAWPFSFSFLQDTYFTQLLNEELYVQCPWVL